MEGVTVGGEFFAFDSERVGLNDRKLREGELLPLLEAFRDGKFSRLKNLILVILVYVQCDENAAGCDSCAAGWKSNRRQRRGDDRRGAEGQQQPAGAQSCEACFFLLCFELLLGC
jgi:hypothetical protein